MNRQGLCMLSQPSLFGSILLTGLKLQNSGSCLQFNLKSSSCSSADSASQTVLEELTLAAPHHVVQFCMCLASHHSSQTGRPRSRVLPRQTLLW